MATLQGMTGFARQSGSAAFGEWAWEAKSVNGRGLDVRVNTPPGLDALQRDVKSEASKRFKRGSLQVSLKLELASEKAGAAINEAALETLISAYRDRAGEPDGAALATLMTASGVFESSGRSSRGLADDEAVLATLRAGMASVLDALQVARAEEGVAVATMLSNVLSEMSGLAQSAERLAAGQPADAKARLERQLTELGADTAVDAERLAAEVAIAAAKADVREELDRLAAHIDTGRALLASGEPAGRKLDFLAQEFNREVNTLCSKSISLELTNAGLALKALVDQFKEQAANVE